MILSGLSDEEAHRRTEEILAEVELTEFKRRKAAKLSSGQKQRLSIARALAKPSKILIADEPTGNLDRENSEKIIALLKRASEDKLVILITHEFDEAKDAATRRIILSDGVVVTDAKLSEANEPTEAPELEAAEKEPKRKPLAPYVCRLTLKSRPVFTAVMCLLLAVTMFISFVFIGNFIVALDDTSTRIYESNAFANGNSKRLIVMRPDGEDFTDADLSAIAEVKHVKSIERYSYANDIAYHYRKDVDFGTKQYIYLLPEYNEVLNPGAYEIREYVELYSKGFSYMRTVPYTGEDILTDGRLPSGAYEIVSADDSYKVGDTVTVYLRNSAKWSAGSYLGIEFSVVGTTDFGSGLYFSDELAAALSYQQPICEAIDPYRPGNLEFAFLPFDASVFGLDMNADNADFVLGDDQYLYPKARNVSPDYLTPFCIYSANGDRITLSCADQHTSSSGNVILVSDATFEAVVKMTNDQVSVYIDDYSYLERVTEVLNEKGYITISPYQIGATTVDEARAQERLVTLAVCAATFIIAFVLQLILLRTMFASLYEYYKLMSSTGLTVKTACLAVSLTLLVSAVIGEVIGIGAILALNAAGVTRIVNIFKYLDGLSVALLFIVHLITVGIALSSILTTLKTAVFGKGKSGYDIDFTLMEEDAQ